MPGPAGGGPVLIIPPPPTSNGDLHVGHLAGPYLSSDIHARYLRACGRRVIYATGTDDSQTFVVASARRGGTTPQALATKCWYDIRRSLEIAGCSLDGYMRMDERYNARVVDFVTRLHEKGKFRLKTVRLPYSEASGEYLMEGLVAGDCPVCLAWSRGGCCEDCGQPNNFDQLLNPRSTVDPSDPLTFREATVLVFPMEEYRAQLTAYYDAREARFRPHMMQLVREVLAKPLPDYPVTYPHDWGIPAPFAETPNQVINAWVEGMPASMMCTFAAAEAMGLPEAPSDELWRAEHGATPVYFYGFDNVWYWGMTDLALMFAHEGRYVIPDTYVCNEFYELEHDKFSTSKGHVIWMRDLLLDVPRDLARFYLAITSPEHQRTNFTRSAPLKVGEDRLVGPWNRIVAALDEAVTRLELEGRSLTVPAGALERAGTVVERFRIFYELRDFSPSRAADAIVSQLGRLERRLANGALAGPGARAEVAGICHELLTLVACAAPILIDLADEVRRRSGLPLTIPAAQEATDVAVFRFPALSLTAMSTAAAEMVG